jgi:hypothetical protein
MIRILMMSGFSFLGIKGAKGFIAGTRLAQGFIILALLGVTESLLPISGIFDLRI